MSLLRRALRRPSITALGSGALLAGALTVQAPGCVRNGQSVQLNGQVHLTLIHTSDIHSRLYPYNLQLGQVDAGLGLGEAGSIVNVGGAARISYVVGRERARSSRVLHIDGGDCFQGAPVFNFFSGEAEIKALSAMGTDAMLIANHEFDKGALNLGLQLQNNASFPILVANYLLEDPAQPGASPLGAIFQPFSVFTLDGLRVGVVGMGNLSSITSIFESPNRLGVTPLSTTETAQFYVDLLRPVVDVVVFVTHLGLENDVDMIENTTGIDVVLGGHNHIVLQPPKVVRDCANFDEETQSYYIDLASPNADEGKVRRYCRPRDVVLAHSGAFAKYVGRLDLMLSNVKEDLLEPDAYDPLNGFEVLTNDFRLFPINDEVPLDPIVHQELEPYAVGLDSLANLDLLVGYARDGSKRFATGGGDSALGNMVATGMWLRLGIQTDFSLTNSTGIRADLVPGPVTVEQMFNIFPFDNSISKMQLSGVEVQDLFDFIARRSAGRGCVSQVQIAGARVVIDCSVTYPIDPGDPSSNVVRGKATHIYIGAVTDADGKAVSCAGDADCPGGLFGSCDIEANVCYQAITPIASYELATSNYLAQGGSGFRVLQRNTTQLDTLVQQRDALMDFIRGGFPCGSDADGNLPDCSSDAQCDTDYVCACPEAVEELDGVCVSTGSCAAGKCVLAQCRDDVAAFQRETCDAAPSQAVADSCKQTLAPCVAGGEQCKFLACVDRRVGNFADGRIRMVGQ